MDDPRMATALEAIANLDLAGADPRALRLLDQIEARAPGTVQRAAARLDLRRVVRVSGAR